MGNVLKQIRGSCSHFTDVKDRSQSSDVRWKHRALDTVIHVLLGKRKLFWGIYLQRTGKRADFAGIFQDRRQVRLLNLYKIERNVSLLRKKCNVCTQKHKNSAYFTEIRIGELGNRTDLYQFCLGPTDMWEVTSCSLRQERNCWWPSLFTHVQ